MTRWGKAGQRLSAAGRPVPNPRRLAAELGRQARERNLRESFRRWRDGLVVPNRITTALDMRDLYGPTVDIACRAREPEVDQWEAGERYPRWDQLVALAVLTGHAPGWFTLTDPPLPVRSTSLWFHMTKAEQAEWKRQPVPVMQYSRAVLDARPDSPREMPDGDPLSAPLPDSEPPVGPWEQMPLFNVGVTS